MSLYKGSCHCGSIQFEVEFSLTKTVTCNCSICSKTGAAYTSVQDDKLQITEGKDQLSLYQFGSKTAKHYFCEQCGIHPFLRPRISPELWAVNLRCIEGLDVNDYPSKMFDGVNWEQTVEAWIKHK
ncbi:MAG: GFA family protein [Pseudomonadales bacterium]|nr:GFA family protein [Pseudomonadales bacterium]